MSSPLLNLPLRVCVVAIAISAGTRCNLHGEETIDFSDQVRPILSDKCFHCHGPDAENQDSEFRADSEENLFADLGGYFAVVPGDVESSELHVRIHSTDEGDQMPPPDSNRSLSSEEKRILDLWIKQGAPYEGHWAFEPPQKPPIPVEVIQSAATQSGWDAATVQRWSINPIDAFVGRRLIESGLAPSSPADWMTQLRRASLTLTGLLPPQELQDRMQADPTESTYREAVDRLLDSMGYAERQTLRWLDAARYADTDGYQNDNGRTNWPWRDWVIKAYHDNMPFDQFTIEQLAGDMLPAATDAQRLATTFNRNHRQNSEGGALAAEFFVENVIDRVETTSTVWMGLTFGCARCHDHKYDPLSQKEFFQLYSYFNNIGERGIGKGVDAMPTMTAVSPLAAVPDEIIAAYENAKRERTAARNGLFQRMNAWIEEIKDDLPDSPYRPWRDATIQNATLRGTGKLHINDDNTIEYSTTESAQGVTYEIELQPFAPSDENPEPQRIDALQIEAIVDDAFTKPNQLAPSSNGNFVLTDVKVSSENQPIEIVSATASRQQPNYSPEHVLDDDLRSGWGIHSNHAENVRLTLDLKTPIHPEPNTTIKVSMSFTRDFPNHSIGKFRLQTAARNANADREHFIADQSIVAILQKPLKSRSKDEQTKLSNYYESIDPELKRAEQRFKDADRALKRTGAKIATAMVMKEREGEPLPAYLLMRGQYDAPDKSEVLKRGVPSALLSSPDASQPADRLELAKWLVSREHPLTARVTINRIWQDHFGTGLVSTTEDFGVQGEVPSHPELLDWLAVEFIESGWDVKAMHRLIVTSQTYRQSSRLTESVAAIDPANRLLARGPRYRSDGFVIRDIALQASGLLHDQPGGPSVNPYQPDGLWESLAANAGTKYRVSSGDALYRKSMYSYWKRAVNPPRQIIFDAGGREVCNVRVRRTNTPLQALVLMNDPTFLEAARKLSERGLQAAELSDGERIATMYQWAIAKPISERSTKVLLGSLDYFRNHFKSQPEAESELLAIGQSARDAKLDMTEHAAWTSVAHLIFNLDQFVSVE
ncbi:PSD1 and planctomycete cytochrome C domain-containing protein [Novipirellula caenicola]|uniref:Planctomycete cytochrome C n=1 Tax=Novipirellula caenicola TaxID=1536901 RepID=A0ABP9VVS9_9BACT